MKGQRVLSQTEKIILRLGVCRNDISARELANKLGGKLPRHILLDKCVVDKIKKIDIGYNLSPLWAREIHVYPAKGEGFKRGKDIIDSGTGRVLPWPDLVKHISPSEVLGKGKSLFIDPEEICPEEERIVVVPASIMPLYPSIQESGDFGKVDEATGIPLAIKPTSEAEGRWLWRVEGVGVRSLLRERNDFDREGRQSVWATADNQVGQVEIALELEIPIGNHKGTRAVFVKVLSLLEQHKTEIEKNYFSASQIGESIRQTAASFGVAL